MTLALAITELLSGHKGGKQKITGKRCVADNCGFPMVVHIVEGTKPVSGPRYFADQLERDKLFPDFVGNPCEGQHKHDICAWDSWLGSNGVSGGVGGHVHEEPGTGVVLLDYSLEMGRETSGSGSWCPSARIKKVCEDVWRQLQFGNNVRQHVA